MMGIADRRDFESTELPVIIGLYGGYGYLNLSYLRMLGVRAPGSSPDAIDVAFFGEGNPPPYDPKPGDKRRVADDPDPAHRAQGVVAEVDAGTGGRQPTRRRRRGRRGSPTWRRRATTMLLRFLHDYPPVFKQVFRNHMITTGTAAIVSGVLSDGATSCGRPGLVTELLGAADGVVSAQYSQDLWKVAQIVQRTPAVAAAFDAGVEGSVNGSPRSLPPTSSAPRSPRSSAGTATAARTTGSCRHARGRTRPSSPTRRSSACATAPTTCRPRRGSAATTPGALDAAAQVIPHLKLMDKANFRKALVAAPWWARAREATRDLAIRAHNPTRQVVLRARPPRRRARRRREPARRGACSTR